MHICIYMLLVFGTVFLRFHSLFIEFYVFFVVVFLLKKRSFKNERISAREATRSNTPSLVRKYMVISIQCGQTLSSFMVVKHLEMHAGVDLRRLHLIVIMYFFLDDKHSCLIFI